MKKSESTKAVVWQGVSQAPCKNHGSPSRGKTSVWVAGVSARDSRVSAPGGLDADVELTRTALTTTLQEAPSHDPQAVLARIRLGLSTWHGLDCLDPLGFKNTLVILIRRAPADSLAIRCISDLRDRPDAPRFGKGPNSWIAPLAILALKRRMR